MLVGMVHGVVGAGDGQAGVVRGVHGGDFEFRHTAADDGLAFVGEFDAHIAGGHTG